MLAKKNWGLYWALINARNVKNFTQQMMFIFAKLEKINLSQEVLDMPVAAFVWKSFRKQ